MLVLRRKMGETIVIDGLIEITVLHVRPGKVRLGIQAPANVRITRLDAEPDATVQLAAQAGPIPGLANASLANRALR